MLGTKKGEGGGEDLQKWMGALTAEEKRHVVQRRIRKHRKAQKALKEVLREEKKKELRVAKGLNH